MQGKGAKDLYQYTIGHGPPILFMHGGPGLDHTLFRPFLDPLAERFTLVFYDHRGNGRSNRPRDYASITNATWADDAEMLRVALGFEQWIVLGDSYGGVVAQEYALRYPERVGGLVLCSTAPVYDHTDVAMQRAQKRGTDEQIDTLVRAFSGPVGTDAEIERIMQTILPLYVSAPAESLREQLLGDVSYSAAAFNRGALELLPAFDVRDRLRDLTVPALALAGEEDWLCPPENGITPFVEAMPNAWGVAFSDCGHFAFAEQPERFQTVLSEWLDSLPRGRRSQ